MRRATVLLLCVLVMAGCLGAIPRVQPVLVIEEALEVPEGVTFSADFGAHCERGRFTEDGFHLMWYQESRQPTAIVVRDFRQTRGNGSFMTSSSGLDVEWSTEPVGALTLRGPLEPHPVVANVSWERGAFRVEGELLSPDAPFVLRREYLALSEDARRTAAPPDTRVSETLTFVLRPDARVTWESNRFGACL